MIRLLALPIVLILGACAAKPAVQEGKPLWLADPLSDTEDTLAFLGVASSTDGYVSARENAVNELLKAMLNRMGLAGIQTWKTEGEMALRELEASLRNTVVHPELNRIPGVKLIHRDAWMSGDTMMYAVEILWNRKDYRARKENLIFFSASSEYRDVQKRAGKARKDGNFYESAMIWATALADASENSLGYTYAFDNIKENLGKLSYSVESDILSLSVGERPSEAVVFRISAGGQPVDYAEFVMTYPTPSLDGSTDTGQLQVYSDESGIVHFLPPKAFKAGRQTITIALSARPFLKLLDKPGKTVADDMTAAVEVPAAEAYYEAVLDPMNVRMGVLLMETDLAGNSLDSTSAVRGLLGNLLAAGYNAEVIPVNPQILSGMNQRDLINLIETDPQFSEKYGSVILGTVRLEQFEKNGDVYSVKVSGDLVMASPDGQSTPFLSSIAKSSQASGSQQAMNAAFRLVGRTFAGQLGQLAQPPP